MRLRQPGVRAERGWRGRAEQPSTPLVTTGSWAFRDQGEAGRGYGPREGKWTGGFTWAHV